MLTYENPGDGKIPAFNPACPGIHCGFCCANTDEAVASETHAMIPVANEIRKLIVSTFLVKLQASYRTHSYRIPKKGALTHWLKTGRD